MRSVINYARMRGGAVNPEVAMHIGLAYKARNGKQSNRARSYGTPFVTKIKSLYSGLDSVFPWGCKNARPYFPGAVS